MSKWIVFKERVSSIGALTIEREGGAAQDLNLHAFDLETHDTALTVGNTVADRIVSNGTDCDIHNVLQHNILGILRSNASNLEQAESSLEKETNDPHN
jgi:hypothetical protein